jgi:hypothetical protein
MVAIGVVCLAAGSTAGLADDTFLCADGTSVTLTDDNRAAMQDHPCVKAWFADDLARRQARAAESEGRAGPAPAVHRTTARAGQAARDLRSRPGYVLWSRSRETTSSGSGSTPLRPRLRLRFGRR